MTKNRTIQLYRGTTAQNNAYTGSAGELTMDTTTNELRLHDGSTAGGHIIGSGGSGSGYHPGLFDVKWADHELNDMAWLRSDTFSWQPGTTYSNAYGHLVSDISGKTLTSETIAGTTVQFYVADDGHKICPANQESNVAAIYTATGVAWYYILDTANQRFKLPRTKFGFTGIRSGVGKYVEAGVPNITGNFKIDSYEEPSATGAFTQSDNYNAPNHGNWAFEGWKINLDASSSSSVYGNSDTVQPKATEVYLYFYVGQFTQTALENTAGLNAELFNGKADVSALNTKTAHVVTEFQEPTTANNYTWYRKYADGWVEQGGIVVGNRITITFPIVMANSNYTAVSSPNGEVSNNYVSFGQYNHSTTGFQIKYDGEHSSATSVCWQVSGMAA